MQNNFLIYPAMQYKSTNLVYVHYQICFQIQRYLMICLLLNRFCMTSNLKHLYIANNTSERNMKCFIINNNNINFLIWCTIKEIRMLQKIKRNCFLKKFFHTRKLNVIKVKLPKENFHGRESKLVEMLEMNNRQHWIIIIIIIIC